MSLHITATVLTALISLSRLFSQASAYAIDQSCAPYVGDHQDKTAMITNAMTAANQMLTHAASVVAGGQGIDNARDQLFAGATAADLQTISSRFQYAADNTPWTITNNQGLVADKVTIYCGGENFSPNPQAGPNAWTDLTSFITVYGLAHNNAADAQFCDVAGLGATLDSSSNVDPTSPTEYRIIVLCPGALEKGVSPESTGSVASIPDLANIQGLAGIYPGKTIDNVVYATCLATVLVHELMHVTQSALFFRGDAEAYGWADSVATAGRGIGGALMNIDNYAFYATAVSLPAIYYTFNGFVGSTPKYNAGQYPFAP
ncbi:hypothetical protein IMSHALPRED_008218 [Imshaugia aleurites]|uniref:Lysine-specific metallo-endopeptidase domain-containing protein n=1 Tax=Imshaugia aleurites TaxID=172621 RepID=A0A8H3FZW6_9LECA|nr:hypothetical protein IMSHALPRED_008218 [Imshaugia aleurites]